jgi:hypothetical protein
MSKLKKFKIKKIYMKLLPLSYNFIKCNDLLIPKSDESFVIKSSKYNASSASYRSSKPVSKIMDFTPIQKKLINEK